MSLVERNGVEVDVKNDEYMIVSHVETGLKVKISTLGGDGNFNACRMMQIFLDDIDKKKRFALTHQQVSNLIRFVKECEENIGNISGKIKYNRLIEKYLLGYIFEPDK